MVKLNVESVYDKSISDRVVYYVASIFFNRRHNTIQFNDLKEAEEMASRMTVAANNGRKGIVYAIDDEGRSVFISSH